MWAWYQHVMCWTLNCYDLRKDVLLLFLKLSEWKLLYNFPSFICFIILFCFLFFTQWVIYFIVLRFQKENFICILQMFINIKNYV